MHIKDYEQVSELQDTDIFLLDGDRGTKTIQTKKIRQDFYNNLRPIIKAGRYLGSHITDEQKQAIDIMDRSVVSYGDYWMTEDEHFMFVVEDFDNLFGCFNYVPDPSSGSTALCGVHHATVMCTKAYGNDENPLMEAFETTGDISDKGYAYCSWRKNENGLRAKIRTALKSTFDTILNYKMALTRTAVSEGYPSTTVEICDVELPSVSMFGLGSVDPSKNKWTRPFTFFNLDTLSPISPFVFGNQLLTRDTINTDGVYYFYNNIMESTLCSTEMCIPAFAYVTGK